MQQSGHSCGHVQCEGGGVYSYSRATRSGGRSLLQLVPAILFGTSQRTTVTRTRPHGCGELRGVRGAFCAPIATPHAEPPLNGVYGLPRVTQGLSERAALSALKELWPSGARVTAPTQEGKASPVRRRVCCPSEMRGFAFFGPVGARPLVKRKSDVDPHQRGRVCSPHVSRQSQ